MKDIDGSGILGKIVIKHYNELSRKLIPVFDKYGYVKEEREEIIQTMVRFDIFDDPADKTYEGFQFPKSKNLEVAELKKIANIDRDIVIKGTDVKFLKHNNREVAKLIKILRQCKKVVIKGTIENPQNDTERKGQSVTTTICSEYTFFFLDLFLNTLLDYQQDDLYQDHFSWKDKEEIDDQYNLLKFKEPYTKKELEQIIEYENKEYKRKEEGQLTSKQILGKRFFFVEIQMLKTGFFSEKSEGKAREYAFIYDCFVILEQTSIPDYEMTDSEKYTFVKDCIRTYINHHNYLKIN